MSSIDSNQERNTFSPVLARGIFAAYLLATGAAVGGENLPAYTPEETNATFNGTVLIERSYTPENFEHEVGKFYARLLESQQPLGADFEKVLHENLWDLYES